MSATQRVYRVPTNAHQNHIGRKSHPFHIQHAAESLADVRQERFVACMEDVQVSEAHFVELCREVAVKIIIVPPFGDAAGGESRR